MRTVPIVALLCVLGVRASAADVCNPKDLQGPFGFQLSGKTAISGDAKPTASLGRLLFDGSGAEASSFSGAISGAATVMFAGFLLGNPVTGTFEAHPDCSVIWSLQDDSGGYQHFKGRLTPDGKRVEFRQTDPGGARQGTLVKTANECKLADLRKSYDFTMSGTSIPMTDDAKGTTISAKGTIYSDTGGNFKLSLEGKPPVSREVILDLDGDCMIHLGLSIPPEDGAAAMPSALRGIVVDGAREILAIQTDPGSMVAAKFTAR